MNNYQWLLQMDGADRKAWFDAEHVETEERALDGDTEPHDADSRERLEADISKYLNYPSDCRAVYDYNAVIGWLDRQAAITERKATKRHELFCETCEAESDKQIAELTAERDEMQARVDYLESRHCDWADPDSLGDGCMLRKDEAFDALKAERDELQEKLRISWEYECKLQAERERYREKFGKCIDYADAIHALMDDEGMA